MPMADPSLSLAEFQARFAASLRAPADRSASNLFVPSSGVPLSRRFDVYRNNVHASLVDALSDIFPAVVRLVGRDFFRAAARAFLVNRMPLHGTLIGFGESFPEFLDEFEPAAALPYLGDVARLELLWLRAYHADEASLLDQSVLERAEDLSEVCVRLHPSAALLSSSWPVFEIWRSNREDETVLPVDLEAGPDFLLVFRVEGEVRVASLDAAAFVFFERLATGVALGEAADAAAGVDTAFDLVSAFQFILSSGAFAAPPAEEDRGSHVQYF